MNRTSLFALPLVFRSVRDHDRILVMYTHERGKLSVLAKGMRKSTSKLAPFFSTMVPVSIEVLDRSLLPILVGAEHVSSVGYHHSWSDDIVNVAMLQAVGSILDALVVDDDPDDRLFVWLVSSLRLLFGYAEHTADYERRRTLLLYGLSSSLLVMLGYGLELRSCVRCRDAYAPDSQQRGQWSLLFSAGGLVCASCGSGDGYRVSPDSLTLFSALFGGDLALLWNLPDSDWSAVLPDVVRLCGAYFQYVCERALPSFGQYHDYVGGAWSVEL